MSKTIGLIVQIIIALTPLTIGKLEFIIGLIIFILGMCRLITAVNTFKNTPLDQPVTRGLYRIYRNPQETSISIVFIGICLSVGSLFLILIFLFSRIFYHYHILAQEDACLKEYGDSYRNYMNKIPRYLLFF
jgi:protein-S-isoprenylcysteine O-methyltransferase Ste14